MALEADSWFVQQYNSRVMHKYQSQGFILRGTVMPAGSIEGTTAKFPISGKGAARKKQRGQQAVPMNPTRGFVDATLVTWEAFDEVWLYDLSRMTANEQEAIVTTGSNALGRATDQEMMDKFDATAPATGTAQFLDKGTSDFSASYALQMCQMAQAQDWPWNGGAFCGLPSLLWNQLLVAKQFSAAQYTGPDIPMTRATTAKTWNGVHWFLLPDALLPVPATNKVDVFLWHMMGFGWANNETLRSMWQWDNRAGCWTVRMESEGAAAALLAEGVIRGRFASNGSIDIRERILTS
jgi:hypothetical protein